MTQKETAFDWFYFNPQAYKQIMQYTNLGIGIIIFPLGLYMLYQHVWIAGTIFTLAGGLTLRKGIKIYNTYKNKPETGLTMADLLDPYLGATRYSPKKIKERQEHRIKLQQKYGNLYAKNIGGTKDAEEKTN